MSLVSQLGTEESGHKNNRHPEWWNAGGRLVGFRHLNDSISMVSDFAEFTLQAQPNTLWLAGWKTVRTTHSGNALEFSAGGTVFNMFELSAAFGLTGQADEFDSSIAQKVLRRLDADVCVPGKFIRKDVFLNVPGPGTGAVVDPNVSIAITAELKSVIGTLLLNATEAKAKK